MKNKYHLVSMFLLFFAILFTVSSCTQNESLLELDSEESSTEISSRRNVGVPGGTGPELGHDSWYSEIRCEPVSGNVAEYKVYHKTLEICNCYTTAWEAANCASDGTGNQIYCQKRVSPNTPFGALCPPN